MGNILEDDLGEMYRQRSRWFLLLGGLLGGIIALAAAFGFWLENWGSHIGGGHGEDAHGIAVGLAVGLTVLVIVIALLIWRAGVLRTRASALHPAHVRAVHHRASPVDAAVDAWTSSALRVNPTGAADRPGNRTTRAIPHTDLPQSPSSPAAHSEQRLKADLATELIVSSDSTASTLAEIIHGVTEAGIDAEGLWSAAGPHGDQVHLVVRTPVDAEQRLTRAGLIILTRQTVVLVELTDTPRASADIFRRLTEAGVTVHSAQLASSTRMVIAAHDPASVIRALT